MSYQVHQAIFQTFYKMILNWTKIVFRERGLFFIAAKKTFILRDRNFSV